jgi:ATP-dependent RNA helicase RhlE
VLGLAPTGSGKTGAFLLPLVQRLQADASLATQTPRRLRVLMLAPTRELASQTGDVLRQLAPQFKTVVAVGGLSINPQMMALRGGAHLVVATPGRLLDLVDHNALHLNDLHTLVLDEADRLLDLGFADELKRVLALLPKRRQTLMFSATMPADVAELAEAVLNDPARVGQAKPDDNAPLQITQRAIKVNTPLRTPLLRHLLENEGWQRTLVFVATQYATELVTHKLQKAGIAAAALHGQLSPGHRSQALWELKQGTVRVLVATDLAARGIDVAQLDVVVNHDLPRSAVDYTHRIGRTGRAGASGVAISFICADVPGSEAHFRLIEKRQGQRVPREQVPGFEPAAVMPAQAVADTTGGIKGKRKSKKDKLRQAQGQAAAK